MKTIFILIMMLVSTVALAGKNLAGDSNSPLANYTLNQLDETLWELSYSGSNAHFTIEVCPKEAECCYLLRGEQIELMYLCSKRGFGLRRMPAESAALNTKSYKSFICYDSFKQQSVISAQRKTTEEALGLIACYFPYVIKNESYAEIFLTPDTDVKSPATVLK